MDLHVLYEYCTAVQHLLVRRILPYVLSTLEVFYFYSTDSPSFLYLRRNQLKNRADPNNPRFSPRFLLRGVWGGRLWLNHRVPFPNHICPVLKSKSHHRFYQHAQPFVGPFFPTSHPDITFYLWEKLYLMRSFLLMKKTLEPKARVVPRHYLAFH